MKISTLAILSIAFFSCSEPSEKPEKNVDKNKNPSTEKEMEVDNDTSEMSMQEESEHMPATGEETPDRTWKLTNESGEELYLLEVYGWYDLLQIQDLKGEKETQNITIKTDEDIKNGVSAYFIKTEDYNMDGHPDFAYRVTGGTGVSWYEYYVYSPAQEEFIRHKELSEMPAVSVDEENGWLVNSSSSMAGMHYTKETYVPIGLTALRLIRVEKQTPVSADSDDLSYTSTQYIDGEPYVTCDMIISTDNNVETHCILEGVSCPERFIYLDPNSNAEAEIRIETEDCDR